MTHSQTLHSLIVRLKDEQNELAWEEFVVQYESFLQRFAVRQGVPQRHVPDVVQNILLAIARSIDGWRPDGQHASFRRWLLQLSRDSAAVPVVHSELVKVHDGEHSYTFAASKGRWTSPTDDSLREENRVFQLKSPVQGPVRDRLTKELATIGVRSFTMRGNRMEATGTRQQLNATEELLSSLDIPTHGRGPSSVDEQRTMENTLGGSRGGRPGTGVAGPGPGMLDPGIPGRPVSPIPSERESLSLAKSLRDADHVTDDQKRQLRALVADALNTKLTQQEVQVQQLKKKLAQVEQALKSRKQNRDRIIQRRVEELLNPNIDWETIAGGRSQNPFSMRPRGGSAFGESDPFGKESAERDLFLASPAGTPIGFPGPPHLPAVPSVAAAAGAPGKQPAPTDVSSGDPAGPFDLESAETERQFENYQIEKMIAEKFGLQNRRPTGDATATGSNIVQQLIYGRRDAEASRGRLQRSWKKLTDLRTHYGDNPAPAGTLARRELDAAAESVQQQQQELNNRVAEWKQTWRGYQTLVRLAELAVEKRQSELKLAENDLERTQRQTKLRVIPEETLQMEKRAVELARFNLRRTEVEFSTIRAIEDEAPHLNPDNFDVDELLKPTDDGKEQA